MKNDRTNAPVVASTQRQPKSPNPVDRHVGGRVRMRRVLMSMSQEKLGSALGVTFQQVQKYEKGTNRIGASRLNQIAQLLDVPVAFFFEGAPIEGEPIATGFAESGQADYVNDAMHTAEGLLLAKAFARIRDPRRRRMLINMANTLADEDQSA